MIVDSHVHLFADGHLPAGWFGAVARHLNSRRPGQLDHDGLARKLEARCLDPEANHLLQDMDGAGIDVVVSYPIDYGVALGDPRCSMEEIVEHNARVQEASGGRYLSFTGIDPRRAGAVDFVRSTLRRHKLHGINLNPQAGFDPACPESLAVCREAVEADVPVLFHSGGANFPLRARYGNPALLGDVQATLPALKFIIGHAGFPYHWGDAVDVARRNPNAYLELSHWHKLAGRDYPRFAEILCELKREVGCDRILWASDHLSGPGIKDGAADLKAWLDFMRKLPEHTGDFTTADVDLMLGGNAQRLFKLKAAAHA